MNGIEKITDRILSDAQAEADEVLAKAETEAASILARYEAQAQREYEELKRRGTARAAEREENLAGASSLEARKDTLAAKQGVLDLAFAQAAERLRALSTENYVALLAALAAKSSFSGNEAIILSPEDRKAHGETVLAAANALLAKDSKPAQLRLSADTRHTGGGLVLQNGLIETNCTFDTLLRLVRSEISGTVATALFA